jgi:hypothetical protein
VALCASVLAEELASVGNGNSAYREAVSINPSLHFGPGDLTCRQRGGLRQSPTVST